MSSMVSRYLAVIFASLFFSAPLCQGLITHSLPRANLRMRFSSMSRGLTSDHSKMAVKEAEVVSDFDKIIADSTR